jgi:deferrochelatase/peroxidase EfeB
MTHAFLTVAVPFADSHAVMVERKLDEFGNPAKPFIRDALRDRGIHFISMTVVRGDRSDGAFLMLEASADGTVDDALDTISTRLKAELIAALQTAGHEVSETTLKAFLKKHSLTIGLGLLGTAGLCFSGTPGMSVERIKREYELARRVRDLIAEGDFRGTPLEITKAVRARIAAEPEFATLLEAEPVDLLLPAPKDPGIATVLLRLGVRALWPFGWPYLVPAGLITLAVTAYAWWIASPLFALGVFVVAVVAATIGLVGIAYALYACLRAKEQTDEPDDTTPDGAILAEVMAREDDGDQNHLAGVSVMKPGLLRRLTLRLTYWVISQVATMTYRPGFLADIGTIHFARWVLLPGTSKLLFFSNFGGSWESYLEDFITKASNGLTGVWSNTYGYPRTSNLFQDGATDGDRFKRWARRQQRPTWFWYSAYPNTTTARIRTNAAIRQGLASVSTEDEAADWLSQLGSRVRSAETIQTPQVQSLLFGGMGKLADAACLVLRLPEDVTRARTWLADIEGEISYGDEVPTTCARILSFTASGLSKLALPQRLLNEFPIAFRQGMSEPHRARNILRDTGDDRPEGWWWGYGDKSIDAALLVYVDPSPDQAKLNAEIAHQLSRLQRFGGAEVHRIVLKTVPSGPVTEAFGFVDGVSQPIIRGTRRWLKRTDAIHVVEPGEFILGYPDNRGYFPTTPTVQSSDDPENMLPVVCSIRPAMDYPSFERTSANRTHDLGANGSFLVIRQLEQDVEAFNAFVTHAVGEIKGHQGAPAGLSQAQLEEWVAAKLVGRWRDGTSLVRNPHHPGTGWDHTQHRDADNGFLLGKEDPAGTSCPFGAHIRRTNPRDSFTPGSQAQLDITNRHRILRVGRQYGPMSSGSTAGERPGLLFMCFNADIERQFEFIQQTWVMARLFHGLDGEVDSILGRGHKGGRLTIPTPAGPLTVEGMQSFVTLRGGGYFFMPGRATIRYLATGVA